jgi:hypothetical protein
MNMSNARKMKSEQDQAAAGMDAHFVAVKCLH